MKKENKNSKKNKITEPKEKGLKPETESYDSCEKKVHSRKIQALIALVIWIISTLFCATYFTGFAVSNRAPLGNEFLITWSITTFLLVYFWNRNDNNKNDKDVLKTR